ncbi:potassium channel subfamily K member 3-like [Stylophora pistillata]|uniref:potassium channel subfamily K member 3-like n=1 Tax=Stylophora pistillata TaxID=50429 RepID=UPI000C04F0D3|nr:potassium channel subfamily K member 3-like [Stylophora pistillata]
MHPLLKKSLLRFGFLHTYAILVAWIFTVIERRDEPAFERMEKSLRKLRFDMNLNYNLTDDDFDNFVNRAAAAVIEGDELDWTLLNSFTFALVAFTTIGYGNITPKTELGKGITIPVCLLGILITMLAFKTSGELFASCIRYLVIKIETNLFKREEPKNVKTKKFFTSCALMFVLYISTSVTGVFMEKWDYVESLYASFATFTTIGFGDYVPCEALLRDKEGGLESKFHLVIHICVLYLPTMIGLSLMSCILGCIVDSVDQIRQFRRGCIDSCVELYSSKRHKLCCKKQNHVECQNQVVSAWH